MAEAARDLGLELSKIDNSLYMDPGKTHPIRPCGRRASLRVDYLSKVGDKIQILGRTVERTRLGYRIITSRRYIDQSLKDMDMEKCNPVSTPGLQVTEKDLATTERAAPRSVGKICIDG